MFRFRIACICTLIVQLCLSNNMLDSQYVSLPPGFTMGPAPTNKYDAPTVPNSLPDPRQNIDTDKFARCRLDAAPQRNEQEELTCRYDKSLPGRSKINFLKLTCDQFNKSAEIQSCDSAFKQTKQICDMDLRLLLEPTGPVVLMPSKDGCKSSSIESTIFIHGDSFEHKRQLTFNEEFRHELLRVIINGTNLSGEDLGDLLLLNFDRAKRIELVNMPQLRYMPIQELALFEELKFIQITGNPNFDNISVGDFVLGEEIETLTLVNASLDKGIFQKGGIEIRNVSCRETQLFIDMRRSKLVVDVMEDDPIKIDLGNGCELTATPIKVFIDLRSNEFEGLFPARIFKNFLESGMEMLHYKKVLTVKVDPIDCCHEMNSWLFGNKTEKNYRQFVNATCLPEADNLKLDFYAITNLTQSCPEGVRTTRGSASWVILLVGLVLVGLIVLLVGCIVFKGDEKRDRHRHHHHHHDKHERRSRSRSESAAGRAVKSAEKSATKGSSGSAARVNKSSEARESAKRKSPPNPQEKSKKSAGTILVQDSNAPGRSPTSPKFVRLISPEKRN